MPWNGFSASGTRAVLSEKKELIEKKNNLAYIQHANVKYLANERGWGGEGSIT